MSTRQKVVRRNGVNGGEQPDSATLDSGLPSAATATQRSPAAPDPAAAGPTPQAEPQREPFTTAGLEELAGMDSQAFQAAMEQATALATDFEAGQEVTGTVVRIDGENVFVDLGGKSEARIASDELTDEEALVGASITARILHDREDAIVLSRQVRGGGMEALEAAMAAEIPVQGRVESRNAGGYIVRLAGARGFCPVSQIDRYPGRDLDRFVGQSYNFLVTELRDREAVLSRRTLQEQEVAVAAARFWTTVKRGDVLDGVVTSVREYGAFVDLGGVEGLIHKSEISWGSGDKPEELLKRWDPVKVKVLELDKKRTRVALTLRLPETSPWRKVGEQFAVGSDYEGTITRIEAYGAFVELAAGITGLLRIGNISWDRINHPSAVVQMGDQVKVRVLELDLKRRRLDLGMRQLSADPLQVLAEKYPIGEEVEGIVQRVDRRGVSLLVDDSVPAWLPAREVELPPGVMLQQRIRRGARMTSRVVELDRQRRQLRCSQTAESDAADVEARAEIKRQSKQSSSLGTFADLLGGMKVDD